MFEDVRSSVLMFGEHYEHLGVIQHPFFPTLTDNNLDFSPLQFFQSSRSSKFGFLMFVPRLIAIFEKKILGPAPTHAHWAQVQIRQGRVQILVKI